MPEMFLNRRARQVNTHIHACVFPPEGSRGIWQLFFVFRAREGEGCVCVSVGVFSEVVDGSVLKVWRMAVTVAPSGAKHAVTVL